MPGGVSIAAFNDLAISTSPAWMHDEKSFLNEAQKRNYPLIKRLMDKNKKFVEGGTKLKGAVMFDEQNTAEFYNPNAVFSDQNPQVIEEVEVPWRFMRDHASWNEETMSLNQAAKMSRKDRVAMWLDLLHTKRVRVQTSMFNKIEDSLTAVPNNADMESSSGTLPYSVFAFNNEETNGLYPGFSTIETIDPTVETEFQPYQDTYDISNPAPGVASDVGLLDAFSRAWHSIKFEAPESREHYMEVDDLRGQFVISSKKGVTLMERVLRESQDHFVNKGTDPAVTHPTYAGIDILYSESMDTVAMYNDGAGGRADEDNATLAGARFCLLNAKYIKMVFHHDWFFNKKAPINSREQPTSWTENWISAFNVFCHSRRRQAFISPV